MISSDVVILTRQELKIREDDAFRRGVARGKFEAAYMQRHGNGVAVPETKETSST